MFALFLLALMTLSLPALAEKNVAVVKLIKGEVFHVLRADRKALKVDDWVQEGAVIRTGKKSFVKLIFLDKSQMNVGPNSEMRIEKFSDKETGVIDLVKGRIRSHVTKDYLQIEKQKTKIFVKTQMAVLGVRGTDFMIATNGKTTSAVLFEGSVIFSKLESGGNNLDKLESMLDRGVRLFPGEFSVMQAERIMPTVPALLNIQQRERLQRNVQMDRSAGQKSNSSKSVVPTGLTGQVVGSSSEVLSDQVEKVRPTDGPASSNPDGYVDGDKLKPANGSFLEVESGVVIPPGPDSVLDRNSNTYIPGPANGSVEEDGSYRPPKNMRLTDDGKLMIAVKDASGKEMFKEIEKPVPIIDNSRLGLSQVEEAIGKNPSLMDVTGAISNDIFNPSFVPGGLNDVSNLPRNSSGGVTTDEAIHRTAVPSSLILRPSDD
jgi:hypothetical protein